MVVRLRWSAFNHLERNSLRSVETRTVAKMFVLAMKARKWLASGCTGYLAAIVDTTKKGKDELSNVPVVNEFTSVLPRRISKLPLIEKLLSRSKGYQELLQSRRRPIVWPRQN